jgi:hypothetical protein
MMLVATLEPVLYERKQHAILFVVAVKKRANMTHFAELGAGKGNGRHGPLHSALPDLCILSLRLPDRKNNRSA